MIVTDLDAYRVAEHWHKGQHRKGLRKQDFIQHPLRVTRLLVSAGQTDPSLLTAALLHDVLEDTECPPKTLSEQFGDAVLQVILEVTDNKTLLKSERKQHQVERAEYLSPHAGLIRLADKIDNVGSLTLDPPDTWGWPRQRAYIAWATRVVERIPEPDSVLLSQFHQVKADAWGRVTGIYVS